MVWKRPNGFHIVIFIIDTVIYSYACMPQFEEFMEVIGYWLFGEIADYVSQRLAY